MKNELLQVEDVARVEICGVQTPTIELEIEPSVMTRTGITQQDLARAFEKQNKMVDAGSWKTGKARLRVDVKGSFTTLEEIENLIVTSCHEDVQPPPLRGRLRGKELHDASVKMYQNSFKHLRTDYFDYYLFHILGTGAGMEEMRGRLYDCGIADFILKEKEAGRIRKLGFSFHGDVRVFDYMLQESGIPWDFVQIQLNYLDWRHASGINVNAEYLYGELAKRNIPAVVMEPLLGGRLSKVHDHIVIKLKQRESGQSVASWAFRFAGSFPGVLTVLSGMTYMEHLQDNLRTYSPLHPLSEDEFAFLQETADLMVQYQTIPCNDCKYCMPCPYGIDIPAILLHYNKCINEGNMPRSGQDEDYRRARRAFLVGYDRSVPKLRQASHCIGCNQCSPDCPQGIDIPKEMQRIDHFVERLKQDNL